MADLIGRQLTQKAEPDQLTVHRRTLRALTGIRFFAAAYVVMFHARLGRIFLDSGHPMLATFSGNGFLAVPLFFILSGFILAYTYRGKVESRGERRRFFEARFARIWPLYALSLLLISVPHPHLPGTGAALATILMLQSWNPWDLGMSGAWNPVCWTLSCELFFYFCFPSVQAFLERRSTRTQAWTVAAVLGVSIAINSVARTLWYVPQGVYRYIPLPVVHLPEFLLGVALGNLFLKHAAFRGKAALLLGNGAATYLSALAALALLTQPLSQWTSLVVPAFGILVYALAAESTWLSRFLSTPLLVLGGGISYAIYLTQIAVKVWVTSLMDRLHVDSTGLRIAATTLALLIVAWLLYEGFENPVRKLLRRLFAAREERAQRLTIEGA